MTRFLAAALLALVPGVALADGAFTFEPPGALLAGSGKGRTDSRIYAPDIRFPIESAPAFANSQVWGRGGGENAGSQCDEENFSYPWRDNYCESRSWSMPLCPSGTGHQGQDLRGATCEKGVHWVLAVTNGTITNVGSYSVYLTAEDGTRFDYLHMQNLQIGEGDDVRRGQRIGKIGNQFGGTPTTVHLHFNIRQNVAGVGQLYLPPYASLVDAYDRLLRPRPDAGVVDASAPEAGVADAGVVAPEPDVGNRANGAPIGDSEGEAGCSVSPGEAGSAGVWLLVLVAWLRRRRAHA